MRKLASKIAFSSKVFFFLLFNLDIDKISAQQPHISSCIQFLDKENNDGNSRFPLGLLLCFYNNMELCRNHSLLKLSLLCPLGSEATMSWKCESE